MSVRVRSDGVDLPGWLRPSTRARAGGAATQLWATSAQRVAWGRNYQLSCGA